MLTPDVKESLDFLAAAFVKLQDEKKRAVDRVRELEKEVAIADEVRQRARLWDACLRKLIFHRREDPHTKDLVYQVLIGLDVRISLPMVLGTRAGDLEYLVAKRADQQLQEFVNKTLGTA